MKKKIYFAGSIRGGRADAGIYERDTDWLRKSDLLIGECTCPSLGVVTKPRRSSLQC